MGPTGGKSFVPAFSRTHPQDGSENKDVGDEDYEKRVGEVKSCHYKHGCLLNVSVRAGESNEGWVSTIEVINDIGATKSQVVCPHGFHQATKEPVGIWTSNQANADPFRHLAAINQRITDGHVPIISHHS